MPPEPCFLSFGSNHSPNYHKKPPSIRIAVFCGGGGHRIRKAALGKCPVDTCNRRGSPAGERIRLYDTGRSLWAVCLFVLWSGGFKNEMQESCGLLLAPGLDGGITIIFIPLGNENVTNPSSPVDSLKHLTDSGFRDGKNQVVIVPVPSVYVPASTVCSVVSSQ